MRVGTEFDRRRWRLGGPKVVGEDAFGDGWGLENTVLDSNDGIVGRNGDLLREGSIALSIFSRNWRG